MNNFIVRTITSVIFVAVIVASFLRAETMILLFALVTGMTVWEFTRLVNDRPQVTVNRMITTVAGVYLFFAMAGFCSELTPSAVFIPYLITLIYLMVAELYLKHEDPIHDWAYTMMAQLYIALPLSLLNALAFHLTPENDVVYDPVLPLCMFVFLWINDAGAYICGSLLGKHKLFPRISPGKSWEGSIGGGILVMLVAASIPYLLEQISLLTPYSSLPTPHSPLLTPHFSSLQWAGLGLAIVVFGTWGDLIESLFKRTLGIKDSGNVLPGHGGMLDRFDSSLLAIPAAVVYIYTLLYI